MCAVHETEMFLFLFLLAKSYQMTRVAEEFTRTAIRFFSVVYYRQLILNGSCVTRPRTVT